MYAFAATPGNDADLLTMITPVVERCGYFRLLEQIATGHAHPESILEVHERQLLRSKPALAAGVIAAPARRIDGIGARQPVP